MTVGLVQLSVGDDPARNLPVAQALIAEAAGGGANFVLTPECTNLIAAGREWQQQVVTTEADDQTLHALRAQAAELGIWLLVGSLAIRADVPGDTRLANRSFLIGPDGAITARYDKIHMFDVTISDSESYAESDSYRPGTRAVLADGPARIGMSVCYDLRFPALYRALSQAGADILAVPSAFNDTTGAAHWHTLLRARAIETGSFVLAPAQCGAHRVDHTETSRIRRSYGHSLAVSPWGEVLSDAGEEPGVSILKLDLQEVAAARSRIPSLCSDRPFEAP
ncbi:carbon-nitrogen hydrolase family protein [Paracoccus aurantiacus]|uniref:Carbon-nitrogen hydrolase family protein n=1 Tax=Paracoccus aurantiacus TaxID=2599412 RepID=A0A5C6S6P6_9RHOB|nr:carbon-nitrogen hydrolase family protein [Paracoccus aurantiacus]TXB70095.1 carbon-nitrogen hydrolase family protein [Paracoccus aurantiacus]